MCEFGDFKIINQQYVIWIPAFAGMTGVYAGMTGVYAGMTGVYAGMTGVYAGMTGVYAGMTGFYFCNTRLINSFDKSTDSIITCCSCPMLYFIPVFLPTNIC